MATVVDGVKLAACPFCGSKPSLKTTGVDTWGKQHYWAKCSNKHCGISTMAVEDQERAAELWNRRA